MYNKLLLVVPIFSISATLFSSIIYVSVMAQEEDSAPTLNLPDDITEEATGPDGAQVTFEVSAEDDVDGAVDVNCDHSTGETFPIGSTTVGCSAEDSLGNNVEGSFTVTVEDTTPPTLNLPDDITEEATGPDGAQVTFEVSAEDDVDGAVDVNCDHSTGETFPIGSTTVGCSAEDSLGNEATASFTATVEEQPPEVEEQPPEVEEQPPEPCPEGFHRLDGECVPISEPPIAQDDRIATSQGQEVIIYVLNNDADPDGDTLTIVSITEPSNGTAMIDEGNGTVRYQPDNSFLGVDTFNYTIADHNGNTGSAIVTIRVADRVYKLPSSILLDNKTDDVVPHILNLQYEGGDSESVDNITYAVSFSFGEDEFEISSVDEGSFDYAMIIGDDDNNNNYTAVNRTVVFGSNRILEGETRTGVVAFNFTDGEGAQKDRNVTMHTSVRINDTVMNDTISGSSSILDVFTGISEVAESTFRVTSEVTDAFTPCIPLSVYDIDSNSSDNDYMYSVGVINCSYIQQHINLKESLPPGITLLQLERVFDVPSRDNQTQPLNFQARTDLPSGTYLFNVTSSVIWNIFDTSYQVASSTASNFFEVQQRPVTDISDGIVL